MKKLYFSLFFLLATIRIFAQNYTVLGSASQMNSCNFYQLTPNSGNQAGAIFQNKTINMNNSFDFTFSNFFGCNGASGADGEAFVLTTNPNGLGNQGEGLGYGGANQGCSFAVEFDTWQNGNHGDPGYDHTAFEAGGSVDHNVSGPVSALPSQSNLDNCQWHTIRIVWDVNTNTMSDYIDGVLRISQVLPNFINTFLCGNPIVNWGWTGSTGGGWNLQQVRILSTSNWVAGINYESCSTTVPFTDISTSTIGPLTTWHWTFGDGGTSTVQNPVHTYPDTGIYMASLIVTDASGCPDTFTHTVHIVAPIALTPTITNAPCNGAHTGSIAIAVAGGFGVSAGHGGFAYNWSNGNQQQTNLGLGAGTYTVTVSDGVCTGSGQYTITQPTALSASTSSTAADCGLADGTCSIVISGGTPPYHGITFAGIAATGGPPTYTATGFIGGTYIANFLDVNNCSAILQYNATVATLPCGISSSTSTTNVSCFGGSDGSATLTVTGAGVSPPATITWTHGGLAAGTGVTISNLPAGTYNYTYTDQNAANTFTGSVTITEPGAAFVVGLATTNISCAGMTNGQAIASVTSGGASPFHYHWSGGQPDNPVVNNLSPGVVTITVSDQNGCTATATGTISSAPALTLNIATTNNACNQFNNGTATANVTGGTTPYQYSWSNIASGKTDYNLSGGSFTVTVTDSASCSITGTAVISEATPFLNTVDSTNIKCFGDSTGTITVNTSGGTQPYAYSWSSDTVGNVNPNLTGANLTTLKAGEYLLTVTDAAGCIFFDSTFIRQPALPLTAVTSQGNVTCYGANNGYIAITLSGGTAPYTYNLQPVPPGTDTIKNLPPGTYAGSIADANNCSVTESVTITSPAADSLVLTHVDNVCNGSSAGSATANFVNATGSVVYDWSNNQSGATISNLLSNTYTITATDANSCTLTGSVVVNQPPAISLQIAQVNEKCYGDVNGSITITTTGGAGGPYTYTWSPNISTTNSATALATGPYIITVTDQNLCTKDTIITITQPAQPLSAVYQVTNVACFGDSTGSVIVTPAGGTPTYSYQWTPAGTSNGSSATALKTGNYAVTVTDLNGCTVDSAFNLTQPATALVIDSSHTNLTCFGSNDGTATVTATGGTSPYAYAWSGGNTHSTAATATGLSAGNYVVIVTDSLHCTATLPYSLTQPSQITAVSTNPVDPLCNGYATGAITYTVGGGAGGYTYNWNPNVSITNSASNIPAGTYVTTVTDASGCSITQTTTLTQPSAISISPSTTPVTCFGFSDGTLAAVASGGTPGSGYSYMISDGTNFQNNATGQFTNLLSSPYAIIVTDQNGCKDTSQAVVAHPNPLTDYINSASPTCSYLTNGQVYMQAIGGNNGYSFSLTGQTTNTSGIFAGLASGTYYITITDSKNCILPDSVTLLPTDSILVSVVPANGEVKLGDTLALNSINNQPGNVTYEWTPATGLSCYDCANPVFNGNYSESYTVRVTNDSGCVASFDFAVNVIPVYDLYIPNAFTPNQDGKNDYWQLYGDFSAIKQVMVTVFNRTGEKVFESQDINFKWDGLYKGVNAPQGVYVYTLKLVWLDNRSDKIVKGSITLLQ